MKYYPFGSLVPNRHGSSSAYRYGFNGKENDNEVMGEGNFEDYGMRMYMPRLGRFFNVDPLTSKYPMLTPYQFASDSPIQNIDLDGLEGSWAGYLKDVPVEHHGEVIRGIQEGHSRATKPLLFTAAGIIDIVFTKGWLTRLTTAYYLGEVSHSMQMQTYYRDQGNEIMAKKYEAEGAKASKELIISGVCFVAVKGISKIYTATKTFKESSEKLKFIRESFEIGKGKNIAWAEGKVGDETVDIIAHSGSKSSKAGTASVPGVSRFFQTNVANKNSYDSEIKILEAFAQKYKNNPTIKGEITIYSEREFCDSCRNAIFEQFNKVFPNVKIKVGADGIK
ncbi:deaminase domain-containing protein [Flavobacterium covae]|uniref:deaminase domain-containing protein n=1 Tax=Flavobacterium covae TaxID=2906076 RepID=UPI0033941380